MPHLDLCQQSFANLKHGGDTRVLFYDHKQIPV